MTKTQRMGKGGQLLSCVQLLVIPWTVAHQAPLSMEFSRQEYCSGLPFPSPRHRVPLSFITKVQFIIEEAGIQVQFHLIQRQHFYSIKKKKAYIIRPLVPEYFKLNFTYHKSRDGQSEKGEISLGPNPKFWLGQRQ